MKRISSQMTFFYKRVFPVLWFGIVALVFIVGITTSVFVGQLFAPILFIPAVMALVGYFLFKRLLFDLVDEVWDNGDALIVKNGGDEERIAYPEIMNVSYTVLVNPARVTLLVRRTTRFGREISFLPPRVFARFSVNPLITDLIERIDAKRRR